MASQTTLPKTTDSDEHKGAVEGDRPSDKQEGNKNAVGALDKNGFRRTKSPLRRIPWAPSLAGKDTCVKRLPEPSTRRPISRSRFRGSDIEIVITVAKRDVTSEARRTRRDQICPNSNSANKLSNNRCLVRSPLNIGHSEAPVPRSLFSPMQRRPLGQ